MKCCCSKEASLDVSLGDLLSALDDAEIQYAERTESRSVYDLQREGASGTYINSNQET